MVLKERSIHYRQNADATSKSSTYRGGIFSARRHNESNKTPPYAIGRNIFRPYKG